MKIIRVKILDATHVALRQPIAAQPGEVSMIMVPEGQKEEDVWRAAAHQHFFAAYDDQDVIYDDL